MCETGKIDDFIKIFSPTNFFPTLVFNVKSGKMDLYDFPEEILLAIFAFLPVTTLYNKVALVCKKFYRLSKVPRKCLQVGDLGRKKDNFYIRLFQLNPKVETLIIDSLPTDVYTPLVKVFKYFYHAKNFEVKSWRQDGLTRPNKGLYPTFPKQLTQLSCITRLPLSVPLWLFLCSMKTLKTVGLYVDYKDVFYNDKTFEIFKMESPVEEVDVILENTQMPDSRYFPRGREFCMEHFWKAWPSQSVELSGAR